MIRQKVVIIEQGNSAFSLNNLLDSGWYVETTYVLPGAASEHNSGASVLTEIHYLLRKQNYEDTTSIQAANG